jgi:actin-related protein 6
MNVERFTIPEILFRPSIIGIDQAGIAESIYNSVEELPERMNNTNIFSHTISFHSDIRPSLYNNILLIGGNCLFPNFKERLYVRNIL